MRKYFFFVHVFRFSLQIKINLFFSFLRALLLCSDETKYIEFRKTRDATLNFPKLLIPSIQVNVDGGRLPQKKEGDAHAHLKWPIDTLWTDESTAVKIKSKLWDDILFEIRFVLLLYVIIQWT